MTARVLEPQELENAVSTRPDWVVKDGEIAAKFQFKDFRVAMAFVAIVALQSEKHNHHPEWSNSWNIVEFSYCTHDVGHKITDLDFKLADLISEAAAQVGGAALPI